MPQLDLFYFIQNSLYIIIFFNLLCYISFFNFFPKKILKSFLSIFLIKNKEKTFKYLNLNLNNLKNLKVTFLKKSSYKIKIELLSIKF